jgi:uroporphyrinogen decarboxylase
MKAFLHRQPIDRTPNGWGGCETTGLHVTAYDRLKRLLEVADPGNRVGTFQFNAIFEPPVLEAIQGDIILLGTRWCPSRFWGPAAGRDWQTVHIWNLELQIAREWRIRREADGTWYLGDARCPPGSLYFDSPADFSTGSQIEQPQFPSPDAYHPPQEIPEELLRRLEKDAR